MKGGRGGDEQTGSRGSQEMENCIYCVFLLSSECEMSGGRKNI